MTSSTHFQPWPLQSTTLYTNPWLAEAFTRDSETLTRALQKTISNDTNDTVFTSSEVVSSFPAPTGSGFSGSDPEMSATADQRLICAMKKMDGGATAKKITKRKPRAAKKCQTTFIMADPANFRQMVQQVTGVRLESMRQQNQVNQLVVKPEPMRLTENGFELLTLDTPSFLFDYSMNTQQVEGGDGVGYGQLGGRLTSCGDGVGGQVAYDDLLIGGSGYGYEAYQSFPTLESWN